jgi:3-hydroxybutyrate dehydrogenase
MEARTLLKDRRALVTGAGSGIGAAVARALAGADAKVTVADVDSRSAAGTAEEIGGEPWVLDLTDTGALDSLSLDYDILVNNAGFQRVSPIEDFPPETFRRMLTLMLEAPFLLTRAALPYMYESGFGRIVNITSVHGLRASPFKSAYVAAKHGLEGLSKVTALEGGGRGVTSTCVSPGYVRTRRQADRRPGAGARNQRERGRGEHLPRRECRATARRADRGRRPGPLALR